ncbi:MAG TPA: hypothetical protein VHN78_16440, partial [Chloroflexota bacterium]|nr:hypothetical protein [Chloroflexota bacterium]
MTEQPKEERRTEQAAHAPEQQAAKQVAEQRRHTEEARLHQEAAEELAHLELGIHIAVDMYRWGRAPRRRR